MTLLDILNRELEGKKIISGGPECSIGATIVSVKLNSWEPMFDVTIRQPDGTLMAVDILDDWDLVVE